MAAQRLIRLPEVMERTGLPRSSINLKRKIGDFPAPIQIGPRTVAWLESDVDEWIEKVIRRSREITPPSSAPS